MSMTVGKLRRQLSDLKADTAVYILFEGNVAPVENILVEENVALAVIKGKGKPRKSRPFTVTEDGLIGGLVEMGTPDTVIAKLFERSEGSIKTRKKLLMLS